MLTMNRITTLQVNMKGSNVARKRDGGIKSTSTVESLLSESDHTLHKQFQSYISYL